MANKKNLGLGALILVLAGVYIGIDLASDTDAKRSIQQFTEQKDLFTHAKAQDDVSRIVDAFAQQRGDLQVQAVGTVKAILNDDNEGLRHQRFILELSNGQTVLVAHNIDLAPRVENLAKGDRVEFYGEYEYNPQGGVIHWTHHDPRGKHVHGWLKHQGKTYQ